MSCLLPGLFPTRAAGEEPPMAGLFQPTFRTHNRDVLLIRPYVFLIP